MQEGPSDSGWIGPHRLAAAVRRGAPCGADRSDDIGAGVVVGFHLTPVEGAGQGLVDAPLVVGSKPGVWVRESARGVLSYDALDGVLSALAHATKNGEGEATDIIPRARKEGSVVGDLLGLQGIKDLAGAVGVGLVMLQPVLCGIRLPTSVINWN